MREQSYESSALFPQNPKDGTLKLTLRPSRYLSVLRVLVCAKNRPQSARRFRDVRNEETRRLMAFLISHALANAT